jgi:RNA polymerase sigma factor (TIGR02999 family)
MIPNPPPPEGREVSPPEGNGGTPDPVARGQRIALEQLVPYVYEELRRMSHRALRAEREGHTLGTTGLVHEAYLRLVEQRVATVEDRRHFFALAARAMRQVLVDHARRHRAGKRGGGALPLTLDDSIVALDDRADVMLALDEALSRLEVLEQRLAQVVECRFFAGYTEEETAETLGVTARTVRRDWIKAKGWLYGELRA